MNKEFIEALDEIARSRGIKKEVIISAIEQALISAFRHNFDSAQNVKVTVDNITGDVAVYA